MFFRYDGSTMFSKRLTSLIINEYRHSDLSTRELLKTTRQVVARVTIPFLTAVQIVLNSHRLPRELTNDFSRCGSVVAAVTTRDVFLYY